MEARWDAPELAAVPLPPKAFAEKVAADLGQTRGPAVEVVRLHLEALDSALSLDAPELLADQIDWQQVRLDAAGIAITPAQVDLAVREALRPHLDEAGQDRLQSLHERATGSGVAGGVPDGVLELEPGRARDYLQAALAGRRDEAIKVVRDALFDDVDVADIMLDILQPAQVELGRLWEQGHISVAHEHYTTAITQLALSLLYPRLLLNRTLLGKSLVATSVGAEAHEIGIRMISDLLEQAGWRTTYLGADVPHADIVDRVAQNRADVLAISATMAGHLREVRALVAALRADRRCASVKVLVGGRPFTANPRLVELVGADGSAPDARGALELCRAWALGLPDAAALSGKDEIGAG